MKDLIGIMWRSTPATSLEVAITIKNIVVEFNKQFVLDSISLECLSGEIIGLVAPNGTGKSTLLNMLMNSVTPNQGTVLIKGK